MKFQVPQFIEIEDKIFGPFTFKQFLYLGGGAGLSFILFRALPVFFAAPIIFGVVVLSLALAFYKINNKPFINVLESGFRYLFQKKLYIWKKEEKLKPSSEQRVYTEPLVAVPRLSESRLKDIAWSLDVHESIYAAGERKRGESSQQQNQHTEFKI